MQHANVLFLNNNCLAIHRLARRNSYIFPIDQCATANAMAARDKLSSNTLRQTHVSTHTSPTTEHERGIEFLPGIKTSIDLWRDYAVHTPNHPHHYAARRFIRSNQCTSLPSIGDPQSELPHWLHWSSFGYFSIVPQSPKHPSGKAGKKLRRISHRNRATNRASHFLPSHPSMQPTHIRFSKITHRNPGGPGQALR